MGPAALVAVLGLAMAPGTVVQQADSVLAVQRGLATLDTAYSCVTCHVEKRRSFRLGVHSDWGIRCDDCHGGDPEAFEIATAHRRRFRALDSKFQIVTVCTSCHSDPNRMRQYGLPADQLAEFRTSRHGQLLLEQRNTDAPTCTDCHDAHTILPPDDARSRVYPANIPSTCARCHDDAALMETYGIPTGQLARYREGAHGVAVFEKQNFAAPTCIDCHGSHAALPPKVTEVFYVCDRCHVLLGRALYGGPHAEPALRGEIAGCVGCHSNHGTEPVAPEQISSLCINCHESDSRAAAVGSEIQERVIRATEDLSAAELAIEELVRAGRPVNDTRFRYRTAYTYYQQLAQVQHSLDLAAVEDLSRRVASISRDISAQAEVAAGTRWEHKLLLVPVWFLALAAIVVAWFKLADLRGRDRRGSGQ
jgi:predicted CXXCH cytochrome family protein